MQIIKLWTAALNGSPKDLVIAIIFLFLIAFAIASSGNISLPLDAHETFVVQTTQEMHDRNDWITPYFNRQPRLKKPPLNYWLTGVTAWMAGSLENIQPWHGRFVSVIAAIGLVILTLLIGNKLYNRKIAFFASVMLATSLGYFNYSHDARPDMLYSMFCTAGFTAFIYAWKSGHQSKIIIYSYLMWVAFALATLTKGPHIPAMFIVASLLFCRYIKLPWKQTLSLIRPVTGFILFTMIAAPWWILVNNTLGGSGLEGTQLGGSLLTVKFSNLFNLYYFYRPLILVVPWVIFIPYAIFSFRRNNEHRPANILMGLLILIPAIILSFGSQERWFYMLPSLVPMIILLAGGIDYLSENITQQISYKWFKSIFSCLLILPLCIMIAVFYSDFVAEKSHLVLFAMAVIVTTGSFIWTINYKGKSLPHAFTITGLTYAVILIIAGTTQTGWSNDRFENYKLAIHAHNVINGNSIYTIGVTPDIYVYYTSTDIKIKNNLDDAIRQFRNTPDKYLFIITHENFIHSIPGDIKYTILHKTEARKNKNIYLISLEKQAS